MTLMSVGVEIGTLFVSGALSANRIVVLWATPLTSPNPVLTVIQRGRSPSTIRISPPPLLEYSDLAEVFSEQHATRLPPHRSYDCTIELYPEVEASELGVGAILSKHSPLDRKLHPCAYFSRVLTSAERNYDVGDRELLVVKLTLEEWRHWLEGAEHPFTVWTDHKNLDRPWSHITPNFVTGLPPSHGNTVILVVVYRFLKATHFIALPKLPSAPEMAQLMVEHVFRVHGLPLDVVSDRGPQFVAKFWRSFCTLLGASVSLSSRFHPETNGQTECTDQSMESTVWCLAVANPTSWSLHLVWAKYARNTVKPESLHTPFTFSTFYYVTDIFYNKLSSFFVSKFYTK
ncbi:hypothetical protein SKAU_G00210340 [Synaphobranchus kaupii]|uniref:Integrase catalytic domain-containing protein n=1 Tax=Synaphobranchus kaupii TaxID=118154 RepID=A0A9Q1F904_SYNKA|nr:hypothetical protein SKAU_G00210340 [Synaphobranchus kaupii]